MTYSLGFLSSDSSQERILLDVIDNPYGRGEQVMFCLDVATVAPGTDVRCDGSAFLYEHCSGDRFGRFPGEWIKVTYRGATCTDAERRERIDAAKANGTYRPTLRELLWAEERQSKRQLRNAEWMRKQRAAKRQPPQSITCAHCSSVFQPKRSTAQFCSTACRVAAHRARSADSPDTADGVAA